MFHRSGRFSVLLRSIAISLLISLVATSACPVRAAPQSAGGSVIIRAAVAPVRYILVDDRGKIREILSNSPTDVTPLVYKNKFDTKPIALSPAIYDQYAAIMTRVDNRRTGVIYQAKAATGKKPAAIAPWLRLNGSARTASL